MALKGRLGAVGEKLTHRAPGPGFEAASLHICGGKACFGYPFPRTPLKWEPPGTGSALYNIHGTNFDLHRYLVMRNCSYQIR